MVYLFYGFMLSFTRSYEIRGKIQTKKEIFCLWERNVRKLSSMSQAFLSSEVTRRAYSGAQEARGFVFVSCQCPVGEDGALIGDTLEARFERLMQKVISVLDVAGLALQDVVKVQLFLTDMAELPALNKFYERYFVHPFPARTTLGVSALPFGASMAMDVVAARGNKLAEGGI